MEYKFNIANEKFPSVGLILFVTSQSCYINGDTRCKVRAEKLIQKLFCLFDVL